MSTFTGQLDAGVAVRLHSVPIDETSPMFHEPHVMQVITSKKIASTDGSANDRYRIVISDGMYSLQAMLATQLNHLIDEEKIKKNTIVRVEQLTSSKLGNSKRLFIILSLQILAQYDHKIGDPQNVDKANSDRPMEVKKGTSVATGKPSTSSSAQSSNSSKPIFSVNSSPDTHDNHTILPIEALSPYQNNWCIKVVVTNKSDIRKWANQRGEGQLFSATFMDDSGEIRATGFNNAVDTFYPKLEVGKVYYVWKGRVGVAKKKFSNVSNDYEITLDGNTCIEECLEAANVPTIRYDFRKLQEVEGMVKDSIVDVLAVVKSADPVTKFISKNTQRETTKRDLYIVDDSGVQMTMTLWGNQASSYVDSNDAPVVAFKGVKVSEFGAKSLSMIGTATMSINYSATEGHRMRAWYDNNGKGTTFTEIKFTGSGGSRPFNREEFHTLAQVKEKTQNLPTESPFFFSTRAMIMHIKGDGAITYPACQTCGKKTSGNFCEKCKTTCPEHYRYMLSMAVSDATSQAWFTGFNDAGDLVFDGIGATEMQKIKDDDNNEEYLRHIAKASCQLFNFVIRAKMEMYMDSSKLRFGIIKMEKLNFKAEVEAQIDLLARLGYNL